MNAKNIIYVIAVSFVLPASYSFARDLAVCESGYSMRMERGGAVCVRQTTFPPRWVDVGPRQCLIGTNRISREAPDGGDLCANPNIPIPVPALDCSITPGGGAVNDLVRGGQDRCKKRVAGGTRLEYGRIRIIQF